MKFEKITLWTYIEADAESGALDCVMSTLGEHLDDKCKVLSYESEDYTGARSEGVRPEEAFDKVRHTDLVPDTTEPHWWL